MLNCQEVTRLVSEANERKLSVRERMEIRFHVMMCGPCTNFANQINFMHEAMRAYVSGKDEITRE